MELKFKTQLSEGTVYDCTLDEDASTSPVDIWWSVDFKTDGSSLLGAEAYVQKVHFYIFIGGNPVLIEWNPDSPLSHNDKWTIDLDVSVDEGLCSIEFADVNWENKTVRLW